MVIVSTFENLRNHFFRSNCNHTNLWCNVSRKFKTCAKTSLPVEVRYYEGPLFWKSLYYNTHETTRKRSSTWNNNFFVNVTG